MTLMEKFDCIDFSKVKTRIDENSPMNRNTGVVTLRIDGLVDVPYVHHHEDKTYKSLVRRGLDMYYANMREYVEDMFRRRISRMNKDIVFLYMSRDVKYLDRFRWLKTPYTKVLVTQKPTNFDGAVQVIYDPFTGTTEEKANRVLVKRPDLFR